MLVDGLASDESVFVEVYARVTPIKGAGFHRVASDILKLRLIKEQHPNAQAFIAFASVEAAESITGWRRAAADSAGIRLVVAELPEATRGILLAAQTRQRMVNVPPTEPIGEQP